MPTLGAFSPLRHVVVGGSAAAIGVASLLGIIGEDRNERFDSKQIVVSPAGGSDGLHITEVVDIDFGDHQRHGYERIIPNDFGVPTAVTAESADAPDDVSVDDMGDGNTRVRIGDPDTTVSGQHRYILEYEYPRATVSAGRIALDIIGTDEELETERFEIVVTGFELTDLQCNVGGEGAEGGCDLSTDGTVYAAVIEPLDAGDGVTIGATIVGRRDVVAIERPPLPERSPNRRAPLAAGATLLGLVTGGGIYIWARRKGRNEVFSGGAADAAYGAPRPVVSPGSGQPLPPPVELAVGPNPQPTGTRLVADERMDELATIEFVPPTGVEPWLGNVLLSEQVTNDTVTAWISGAAAHDYLSIVKDAGGDVVLSAGPRFDDAAPDDQRIMRTMLGTDDSITLGKYSKSFSTAWAQIKKRQTAIVDASGYWKRPLSSSGGFAAAVGAIGVVVLIVGGLLFFKAPARGLGLLDHPIAALALAIGVPAALGFVFYGSLLPVRTAEGSALTLRAESFRRFLGASEGQHVEWAWKHGLLREYSAWAVALGAAKAWERAMERSNVPPTEYMTGPMIVYVSAGSFHSTHTAPSSSGGSGGGFSGGSVGGGGGGGSSGSW